MFRVLTECVVENKMANVQDGGWIEHLKTFLNLKSLNEYSYQTTIAQNTIQTDFSKL